MHLRTLLRDSHLPTANRETAAAGLPMVIMTTRLNQIIPPTNGKLNLLAISNNSKLRSSTIKANGNSHPLSSPNRQHQ